MTAAPKSLYTATVAPYRLEAFYEPDKGGYRVLVSHVTDSERRMERFVLATWEPRFGIDVQDMGDIQRAGEEMAAELEGRS